MKTKTLRQLIRARAIRVWLLGLLITTALIYLQASISKWILFKLTKIDLSMAQAIVIVIILNLSMGFYKGIKIYGKAKKTIKKAS